MEGASRMHAGAGHLGRTTRRASPCRGRRARTHDDGFGEGMHDSGRQADDEDDGGHDVRTRRSPAAHPLDEPWGQIHEDDLQQFLFQDSSGKFDGCYTFSSAEAVARAIKYGLTVVERRWGYRGQRVYWPKQAETADADNGYG